MSKINKTIAVITGMESSESDVSKLAASSLVNVLQKYYSEVVELQLNTKLPKNLLGYQVDAVFPCAYGLYGEDGCLQGLLEVMDIPYVGSQTQASANALNKVTTKTILQSVNMPMVKDQVIFANSNVDQLAQECIDKLGDKVVVKPALQGSGIGVQFPKGLKELKECVVSTLEKEPLVLVEEFIVGREITVGVLDLSTPKALPVIEVLICDNTWYSYEYRYDISKSQHVIPASIDETLVERLQSLALLAHQFLGCRDMSRSDFILPESGNPVFLELNSLPGMTPMSLFPDGAQYEGLEFDVLVFQLTEQALRRKDQRRKGLWNLPKLQ